MPTKKLKRIRTIIDMKSFIIEDATQKTIAVIGQKGTGKTFTLAQFNNSLRIGTISFDVVGELGRQGSYHNVIRVTNLPDGFYQFLIASMENKHKVCLVFDFEDYYLSDSVSRFIYDNLKDIMVIYDEMSELVPQRRGFYCLYVEKLVKLGRNKNIGIILSTQRPQLVSKNVLALADTLILFRMVNDADVKYIRDILKYHLPKQELNSLIAKLHTLKLGHAIVIDFTFE